MPFSFCSETPLSLLHLETPLTDHISQVQLQMILQLKFDHCGTNRNELCGSLAVSVPGLVGPFAPIFSLLLSFLLVGRGGFVLPDQEGRLCMGYP